MLSKEEEYRVAAIIDVFNSEKEKGNGWSEHITLDTIEWLAKKLREVNNECKVVTKNYEKADRTLGNVYANPKNDISDRWYPR